MLRSGRALVFVREVAAAHVRRREMAEVACGYSARPRETEVTRVPQVVISATNDRHRSNPALIAKECLAPAATLLACDGTSVWTSHLLTPRCHFTTAALYTTLSKNANWHTPVRVSLYRTRTFNLTTFTPHHRVYYRGMLQHIRTIISRTFARKKIHTVTLYNTKTREKELFTPIRPHEVRMYSCGPTVYSTPHIGNLRSVIFSDTLYRTLVHAGYSVKKVMNITDVGHLASDADTGEDKMEKAVREQGKRAQEIAAYYTDIFFKNLAALNVDITHTTFPRATAYIREQIAMVQTLEEKGYTYRTSDGVYFDTSRFPTYADFARLDVAGLSAGERVAIGEKRNATDFALWKLSPKDGAARDQEWESPWGVGFPGWHIECSAMSRALLGKHFDIHTGGIDHIPVHHTNEIAQSECANGCDYVNVWMHGAFLTINKEKLAKSLGNSFSLADVAAAQIDPLALRYYFLGAQYRTAMDFSWEALRAAASAYQSLIKKVRALNASLAPHARIPTRTPHSPHLTAFNEAIFDDLNTSKALAALHEMLHSTLSAPRKIATLRAMDRVLGLRLIEKMTETESEVIVPERVKELADERVKARAEKRWADADRLRTDIATAGFDIHDTSDGFTLTPRA